MEGLNDWVIVECEETTETDPDETEDVRHDVLQGVAARMANVVRDGGHGAVKPDDPKHPCCLVKFQSNCHTLQEDTDNERQGNFANWTIFFAKTQFRSDFTDLKKVSRLLLLRDLWNNMV